jgi:hypothetical protein
VQPIVYLAVIILFFVAVVAFVFTVVRIVTARRTAPEANKTRIRSRYEVVTDFLSAAERSFFGVLQQAVSSDFIIFAKVRLADIVRPVKNPSRSEWQSAFNRICGKHVDFVLCDPALLTVVLAIELDDRSHGSLESGFRDNLVDSALADSGIPILRVPARHSYAPLQLREKINAVLGGSAEQFSETSNEQ